tara:strand:- start:3476 stop:4087 length:612 start_codon:yes stop_codon:yes gene_type:complete
MAYRPTEKTKTRKESRRILLLNCAILQINAGGFSSLTMDNLANSAGIAVGTVYKYFDSKSLLFVEIFKILTEKEVSIIREVAIGCGTPYQRLNEAIATFSRRAMHSQKQSYALIFEPVNPMIEIERLKYRKAYAAIFKQIIDEGIAKKEFIPQPTDLAATAIVGIIAEVLIRPLTQDENTHIENTLIEKIQEFCIRALTIRQL